MKRTNKGFDWAVGDRCQTVRKNVIRLGTVASRHDGAKGVLWDDNVIDNNGMTHGNGEGFIGPLPDARPAEPDVPSKAAPEKVLMYNIYSAVSDRFIFESSISEEELKVYIKEEYGSRGLAELGTLLRGTSEKIGGLPSLETALCHNRVGADGSYLIVEQRIEQFLS